MKPTSEQTGLGTHHDPAAVDASTNGNGGDQHQVRKAHGPQTAFGCPRDFLENRYVYAVISPRARGLSIGINLSPDKRCNFNCVYCEVERTEQLPEWQLDLD